MMASIGLGWTLLPLTMLDDSVCQVDTTGITLERKLGYVIHREMTLSNADRSGGISRLTTQAKLWLRGLEPLHSINVDIRPAVVACMMRKPNNLLGLIPYLPEKDLIIGTVMLMPATAGGKDQVTFIV